MSEQVDHRVYSSEFEYGILYNRSFEVPKEFWDKLPYGLEQKAGISMRGNGSRIYPDCGHVEYAAPESATLDDFVHAELAGEEIIIQALDNLASESSDSSFRVQKRGIDSSGNNYGSHVSFNVLDTVRFDRTTDANKARNVSALAALYSARIALIGGGYYNANLREWHVSQRIDCFNRLTSISCHGKGNRPLVDVRNESFAKENYRRLHDSSSDPNISIWALRTKVGFTSAYLRLLEHGVDLEQFYVAEPLVAARKIARDVELKATIELGSGKRVTALNQLEGMAAAILQYHENGGYVPKDELAVVQEVHEVATTAGNDRDVLLYKSDWLTRMLAAEQIADKKSKTYKEYLGLLAASDQHYDMLACKTPGSDKVARGIGRRLRDKMELGDFSQRTVDELKTDPPQSTRAWLRGKLIQAGHTDDVTSKYGSISGCSWDIVKFRGLRQAFDLAEPKRNQPNRLMRRVLRAAAIELDQV